MAGEADDFLDGEVPEMTDAQVAEMRPAREVMTPDEFAAVTGRGRPRVADPKVPVTIRLDREVVEAFKATGKGWQTKMNATLKRSAVTGRFMKTGVKTTGAKVSTLAASVLTQGDYKIDGGTRVTRSTAAGQYQGLKAGKKGGKKDRA